MKVAILGDSHGERENIDLAMAYIEGKVDLIIHTGDVYEDIEYIGNKYSTRIIGVRGNCDFHAEARGEIVELVGTKRFFVTHGHKYNVKFSLDNIFYKGKEVKADLVVFGHTHIPYYMEEEGMILLNPGSISIPRGGSQKSIVIVEIQNHNITLEKILIEKGQRVVLKP